MSGKSRKGGLGKGLDALFEDNNTNAENSIFLRVSEIEPNKSQPRRDFEEAALADLADSIREHGVLQPLLVRPLPNGTYQLVAGERRWRAARMAGLTEVPVLVRELGDAQALEIALIENLQREDLNPVEEALGYQSLSEEYGMTQEQIAKGVGKSRPVVANAMRLLSLPEAVLALLREGSISTGHARALLAFEDPEKLLLVAQRIVSHHLTVRDVERLAQAEKEAQGEKEPQQEPAKPNFYRELELAMSESCGRSVKVHTGKKKDKGTLVIEFFDREDLADIVQKLTGETVDFHVWG